MTDEFYMRRAIELAKKGRGWTNPNPMVGAVIVKNGSIIGEGYHEKCGELHAERNAIASLTESAEGATLYVTLEPCCHYGKTPPCTEAILEQKIARVVIGSRDPNPKVSGKGAKILREAGVRVEEDFLREECDALNPVFFHYITTGLPYVVMKYAMTADGKIATKTGASKWISGEEARSLVHEMRHDYMAIMAGIGTVLADDPMLNVRLEGKKSPVRIICDSMLRIPLDSQICQTAGRYRTIVAYAGEKGNAIYLEEKKRSLEKLGVVLLRVPSEKGEINLQLLMRKLGELGIDSVLIEGGGTLNEDALQSGIVNEVKAFIAPKIFGGRGGKTPVEGFGIEKVDDAIKLQLMRISQVAIRAKKVLGGTRIGDSIAVNGVCLTVVSLEKDGFTADVMAETVRRTNLGDTKIGEKVNLERAMAADGRFGGHIVAGHIDGTGMIEELRKEENAVWVKIRTTPEILELIVEKGSICIDGISLTVAEVSEKSFQVSVIPHTGEETTLLKKKAGDRVNLENDIVGKYIKKFLTPSEPAGKCGGLTMELLEEYGI